MTNCEVLIVSLWKSKRTTFGKLSANLLQRWRRPEKPFSFLLSFNVSGHKARGSCLMVSIVYP
jgi:hypothetical protein